MIDIKLQRDENDKDFDISDNMFIYINQLKMVLLNDGSIMGAPEITNILEEYLYEYNVPDKSKVKYIETLLFNHCTLSSEFPTVIELKKTKGNIRPVYILDINVSNKKNLKFAIK
jgi:hypothetical protein